MRHETPLGPVWTFPDYLPPKVAMQGPRLELMWPTLEGFTAMHSGPRTGGVWFVRAPKAALEARGLMTGSASELPVKEGTVWPPFDASLAIYNIKSSKTELRIHDIKTKETEGP